MNASYVYGLQIVNAHMKRALGAVTTWDTFKKMTEGDVDAANEALEEPQSVHVAPHVQEAAGQSAPPGVYAGPPQESQHHNAPLRHSHESEHAHRAVYGQADGHAHQGPDASQVDGVEEVESAGERVGALQVK